MFSDDFVSQRKYIDQLHQLRREHETLQEKYDTLQSSYNEYWKQAYQYSHESQQFERQALKYKRLFLSFLAVSILCIALSVFSVITASRSTRNNSINYASGYNDALSGEKPKIETVECYLCGYHSTEYNSENVQLFLISDRYVPICVSCLDKYSHQPVDILGEEYIFTSTKPD